MSLLHSLLSCAVYSAGATLFYKKSFRQEELSLVSLFVAYAYIIDVYESAVYSTFTAFIALLLHALNNDSSDFNNVKLWKGAKLDVFLTFLLVSVDVKFRITEDIFPLCASLRIFVVALPQFLRRPVWIKAKLQGVRSKLGPVFVLYLAVYAYRQVLWSVPLLQIASLSAVLAGVVFRPDNGAVLELLGYTTKLSERRFLHGRLMITSFVLFTIYIVIKLFS